VSGRSRGGSKRKKKSSPRKKKLDPKKFWGDHDALPSLEGFETSTPDPVAVVNSLGQPPLPGHGAASPHYFKLVYSRATQLAGALAMAGEIDELRPIEPPEPAEPGNEAEDDTLAEADDSLAEASADDEAGDSDRGAAEDE